MAQSIRAGQIVVVIDGLAHGNNAGTITKIVVKPGTASDLGARILGKRKHPYFDTIALCERIHCPLTLVHKYMNKPVSIEYLSDIRLATAEERKTYYKLKRRKS